MFKKRIVCNMVSAVTAVTLVFCTFFTPVFAETEAQKAFDSVYTPVYSMTLDFELATPGTYTKSGGEGTNGSIINDGGGLDFNLADSQKDDISVTVMTDTTGKFGGKVLRVNPFTSSLNSGYRYATLKPDDMTITGSSVKAFTLKDANGARLDRGYVMHYSYDFYISGVTSGLTYQDLRWRSNSADILSESLLCARTTYINNPNTSLVPATSNGENSGTIGWKESTQKKQTTYGDAIRMDYVADLETGEIWMYMDGVLFACRDFSEVPKSNFKASCQSLDEITNLIIQFRQNTKSDELTAVTYYDNFQVDMYGSEVSASALRQMVTGAAASITRNATADFEDSTKLINADANGVYARYSGTNLYTSASTDSGANDIAQTLENGRLKVQRNQTAKAGFVNINLSAFNNYSETFTRTQDLPVVSGTSNYTMNGTNAFADAGVRYARFGYDREAESATDYDIHIIDGSDFVSFEFDVEIGKNNANRVRFCAQYYQADGRSSSGTDLYAGTKGSYNPYFVGFDISGGEKNIKAFDTDTGFNWVEGKSYHVNYLVNLHDGTQITYLDGVEIGRLAESTIPTRGCLPRFRGWFAISENLDSFYLDNVDFNLYGSGNTSFALLENATSYGAAISEAGAQLDGENVNVTAKISGNADLYPEAQIIAALYQNYGTQDCELISSSLSDYTGKNDAYSAVLATNGVSLNLTVKLFIWTKADMKPLCESVTQETTAATLAAVFPNNGTKALTIGFDDCNDTANNALLAQIADYNESLSAPFTASFNVIGNQISNLTGDYTGMDIITHGQEHRDFSDTTVNPLPTDSDFWIGEYKNGLASVSSWVNTVTDGTHGSVGRGLVYSNNKPAPSSCTEYYEWLRSGESGISFARGTGTRIYPGITDFDMVFTLPTDWYSWAPTCTNTSNFINTVSSEYVELSANGETDSEALKAAYFKSTTAFDVFADSSYQPEDLRVYFTWAHPSDIYKGSFSSEITDISKSNTYAPCPAWNWELLMNAYITHQDEIWLANQTQLYDYIKAAEGLRFVGSSIVNDADIDVYVRIDGAAEATKIPANGNFDIL